jgi:hypothetical protein
MCDIVRITRSWQERASHRAAAPAATMIKRSD